MRLRASLGLVLVAVAALAAPVSLRARARHPSELEYPKMTLSTPDYEELEFDSGLTGFFVEDHEIPMVSIRMRMRTAPPPADKVGLNRLTAWVIRNGGSENWPGDLISDELEFVGAQLEFLASGRGVDVRLSCLSKDLPLCLEILGDLLRNPSFPEDQIELKRESMLEGIRRQNDEPRRIAYREFKKLVYGDHPLGRSPTLETVAAITRDDLVARHRDYFRPDNAVIGVTGDVTRDEIVAALESAFAGWQPGAAEIPPEPEIELAFRPSVNYIYKDINQAVILIGHLGLNSRDENRVAVKIMNSILGGGSFTSRITQRVRTDEGLAYAAYSQYTDDPWAYGTFVASSQTKAEAAGRAIALILELIREMRDDGPSEDEFERAREMYLNNHVFDYESKAAVVERLVRLKVEGRPLDTAERDLDALSELSIEDVRRAAAEYLHPEGLTILVVGDQDDFDQPLSNFGDVHVIALDD